MAPMNDLININNGYSIGWFIIMYLIGAYIRKYELYDRLENKYKYMYFYGVCIIITWLSRVIIEFVTINVLGEAKGMGILVNYISPTIVSASIFLFLSWCKYEFKNKYIIKIIKWFAPVSFSVYLIHDNNLIRNYFIKNSFINLTNGLPIILIVINLIIIVLSIYLISTFLEYMRLMLFKILKVNKLIDFIEYKLNKLEFKLLENIGLY